MKPYIVTLSFQVPVVAKSEIDAIMVALEYANDEYNSYGGGNDLGRLAKVRAVKRKSDLPKGFRGCLPWGQPDGREEEIEWWIESGKA